MTGAKSCPFLFLMDDNAASAREVVTARGVVARAVLVVVGAFDVRLSEFSSFFPCWRSGQNSSEQTAG
jgi:hypothetical protein